MSKKILLIDPPFQKFMNYSKNGIPLGLLSIAGSLKSKGHDVQVLDTDYNPSGINFPFIAKIEHYQNYLDGLNDNDHVIWKNISSIIQQYLPDVVGITMQSTKVKSGLRVAEIAKNLGVERVVAGGPHVTLSPDEISANPYIDSVGIGEAELNFEESFINPRIFSERIQDLDSLPLPARDTLIGLKDYVSKDLGLIMSARGCPFDCYFCASNAIWGQGVRERSLENVFKEIEEISSKYGTKEFYIVDDTFTLKKERVKEFGNWMKNKELYWSCLTRIDTIDDSLVKHMKNSNCKIVKIGIESGNERVLRTMNKKIDLKKMIRGAEILNKNKMDWVAYFVIATPEETTEEMYDSMRMIEILKPTFASPNIYTNTPGSVFAERSSKNRDKNHDLAWELANYHSLMATNGKIPKEDLKKFMELADAYNRNSEEARKLFSCG